MSVIRWEFKVDGVGHSIVLETGSGSGVWVDGKGPISPSRQGAMTFYAFTVRRQQCVVSVDHSAGGSHLLTVNGQAVARMNADAEGSRLLRATTGSVGDELLRPAHDDNMDDTGRLLRPAE